MSKTKKVESKEETVTVFESFRKPDTHEFLQNEPSYFNGWLRLKKYKITIELIDEPNEVYQQRLQDIWDISNNNHSYWGVKSEAKKLGFELVGEIGNKIKPQM